MGAPHVGTPSGSCYRKRSRSLDLPPSAPGGEDDDDVATERPDEVDGAVDDAPTSQDGGVLRVAETCTQSCGQYDCGDDRISMRVRRRSLLGHGIMRQ